MLRVYAFATLLLVTSGYALWRGGAPERVVAAGLLSAYVATVLSWTPLPARFHGLELNVFAVDAVLLAMLMVVAIRADRAWPLLVAALQLDAVGAHFVKLVAPDTIRVAYALLIAIWSWPVQIVLAVGTWRHVGRMKAMGCDRSWALPE
jgi:hypothetical protein